ncbi:MAG: PROBABLE CONSERVED INTEGRAL MEMBRANE ALANINE AND LEUCINE RICH PROTEIN, partial [uncultured Nocardioidaceae bacterium]
DLGGARREGGAPCHRRAARTLAALGGAGRASRHARGRRPHDRLHRHLPHRPRPAPCPGRQPHARSDSPRAAGAAAPAHSVRAQRTDRHRHRRRDRLAYRRGQGRLPARHLDQRRIRRGHAGVRGHAVARRGFHARQRHRRPDRVACRPGNRAAVQPADAGARRALRATRGGPAAVVRGRPDRMAGRREGRPRLAAAGRRARHDGVAAEPRRDAADRARL